MAFKLFPPTVSPTDNLKVAGTSIVWLHFTSLGLWCIQWMRSRISNEYKALLTISYKVQCEEDETTWTFFFKLSQQIRELILLQRCIKFNLLIRVWLALIRLWAMQSNYRLNLIVVWQYFWLVHTAILSTFSLSNNNATEMGTSVLDNNYYGVNYC